MSAFRLRTGFISGVLAFVVTYVLVAIVGLLVSPQSGVLSGASLHHALFYHAHNPLSVISVGPDPFGLSGSLLWVVALVIPPVILSAQARELADSDAEPLKATQQSCSVAIGYAPLALAGLAVLGGDIEVLDAVLAVGVYPVGFGVGGGVLRCYW